MKAIKNSLLIFFISVSLSALAQPPAGGRPGGRPGGGPEEMIKREQQTLNTKITDLTTDQKMLIDGIYEEFATTLKETMEEQRQSNNREGRREKMEVLRQEKDELIADVLNEDQYKIYQDLSKTRRERKENENIENPN